MLTHTRKDLSHREKVGAGVRDLRDLYVRANACVACHQTVETALTTAGHPELIFELDGQSVTQPRHWKERGHYRGGQAWLVGQAAALRETSAQLSGEPGNASLKTRWAGIAWLLQKLDGADAALPSLKGLGAGGAGGAGEHVKRAHQIADELGSASAKADWSPELSSKILQVLAGTHAEFRTESTPLLTQARRAERLVLALDRLVTSLDRSSLAVELNPLFDLAQSIPDFNAGKFADALESFAKKAARGR